MDVGVFALIRNTEDKILLVKDATRQQLWTLPGGGPEIEELMPETVVREVKEETSVDIEVKRLLGVFSQKKTLGIVLLFEASIVFGEPVPDGVETQACAYFSLKELLHMKEQIKPAQLSMIYQVEHMTHYPIFEQFIVPQE